MQNDRSNYSHILAVMPDDKAARLQIAPNPVSDGTLRYSFAGADGQPFEADVYSSDGRVLLIHKQTDATAGSASLIYPTASICC